MYQFPLTAYNKVLNFAKKNVYLIPNSLRQTQSAQ